MSEFDIFFDEYENKHNCSPEKYECYEAGAQSKQAEIDELQRKYDAMYNAFTYSDDCRKEWHESFMRSKEREDELRKRIDEALQILDEFNCPTEYGIDEIYKAIEILKGTTNEQ